MKKLFRKILVYELLNQNSTKKAEPALFSLLECSQDPVIGVPTWYLLDFPSEFMTEATWKGKIGMLMN